jgi:Fungal protein kinase
MRLWEFDRLGVVGSTLFDVNKDGQMLVSAILGYLWMSEEELGFGMTTLDDGGRYTQIQRGGRMECLGLKELIKRQRFVPGRATTCWRGSLGDDLDGGFVIKDSWEFEETTSLSTSNVLDATSPSRSNSHSRMTEPQIVKPKTNRRVSCALTTSLTYLYRSS